jgi:hypothetical protein
MTLRMFTIATGLLLLLSAFGMRISGQGKDKAKISLGKETTYVTGPIALDGLIDYETALNERLSEGISPERNATVGLWRALNPRPVGSAMPPEFFRWLKIPAPPERGRYFADLPQYARDHEDLTVNLREQIDELSRQRDRAARRPWVALDYPQLAHWLDANQTPLAMIREASRCPDYYNPLVSRKSGDEGWFGLLGALLPGALKCRETASALVARAMLHAGEGRVDEAWQDLLTCHRLGRLLGRGADHLEIAAGAAISRVATEAELVLLDHSKPSRKQALAWLRDVQQLPARAPIADRVDCGGAPGRFAFLNTVMLARRGPINTLKLLEILEQSRPQPRGDSEAPQAVNDSIDWDSLLRAGNAWYDRVVAALRVKDRAAREKKLDQIEEEVKTLKKEVGTIADVSKAVREGKDSGKELTKKLGAILTTFFWPGIRQMQVNADRSEQIQRNLCLALALAAYRADQQRYPEKLEALVPKYLEKVPGDLYSGKAMIYRLEEKGYLLYSVGVNGRDDGGHWRDDTPPGDDVRVRMPLPETKRK